jgi:hypothetical protein
MKKIILILCVIMTTTVVHATQMCARRNTTVIPLDSIVAYNSKRFKTFPIEWMWAVFFDFGTTYGFGTCLSVPEILEMTPGWTDTVNMPQIIPTDNEDIRGRSGIYTASDGTEHERKYCYSKLIHPMSSQWVRAQIYNNAAACTGTCPNGYGAVSAGWANGDTRTITMYNSVGVGLEEIDGSEYDESVNLN